MIWLSHKITNKTPLYGGAKTLNIKSTNSIKDGSSSNSLYLSMPNHCGTHIDVPKHFIDDGKTIDQYSPDSWIFNSPILIEVEVEDSGLIEPEDINRSIGNADLLLFRTRYEKYRERDKYWKTNPGLSPNLARFLRENCPNLRAIGLDSISISSYQKREEGREAHKIFLGNDFDSTPIILIEDMSLVGYKQSIVKVVLCPLIIENGDGAPCTVFGFE